MTLKPEDLQLRDIAPAEPYLLRPDLPWWVWAAIIVGLLLLGAICILVVRRLRERSRSASAAADPAQLARAAYEQACGEITGATEGSVAAIATTISAALRGYLATACGDPSLFETHEEFLARHEALAGYPDETRRHVSGFFDRLARAKYGRDPDDDPEALRGSALELLEALHPPQRS